MNEQLVNIEGTDLSIREYNGQRVVTFKDIDEAHQKSYGTTRRTFYRYKKHFSESVDYYLVQRKDSNVTESHIEKIPPKGIILLTERGYLKVSKAYMDDKAWKVQDRLIDAYFMVKYQNSVPEVEEKHIFPEDHDWFRNNEVKIRQICEYWKIDVKTFMHVLLKNISTEYYFDGARAQYIKETQNYNPSNSDVITYFSNIRKRADELLNNSYTNMLKHEQEEEATSN